MKQETHVQDWMERELFPAVFASLPAVFPEFGWKKTSKGWSSTRRVSLVGDVRPDRVVCNKPGGVLIHGDGLEPISWTALVLNQTEPPKGAEFFEALRKLGELAGVDCSPINRKRTPEEVYADELRKNRREVLEGFVSICTKHLFETPDGVPAWGYLQRRGFTDLKTVQPEVFDPEINQHLAFLGFSSLPAKGVEFGVCPSFRSLVGLLESKGFRREDVVAANLLKDARWEGRLVHPVRDLHGNIETIWARDITGTAQEGAKYLKLADSSQEVPLFNLTLSNRSEPLVVVEGYMDALLFAARGVKNVASTGGTFRALKWGPLLELGFPSVHLVTDNDTPKEDGSRVGKAALLDCLKNLSKVNKGAKVYVLPPEEMGDAKDPDEYIRAHGVEAFTDLRKKREVSWAEYVAANLMEGLSPDAPLVEREDKTTEVLNFTSSLGDSVLCLSRAERIFQILAERTGLSKETLLEADKNARERKAKEDADKDLKRAAENLVGAIEDGKDTSKLRREIFDALGRLEVSEESAPPVSTWALMVEELRNLPEGLETPWEDLNSSGVRLRPQELVIVAARTGHGKTSVLTNLALHLLKDKNSDAGRVLFYTHEEPVSSVLLRWAVNMTTETDSRWSLSEARDWETNQNSRGETYGWPSRKVWEEASQYIQERDARFQVVNRPAWTASQIAADVRKWADREPVAAVFVDYLQRLPFEDSEGMRKDEKISAAARVLKSLAVDLGVPVITGAQINRDSIPAGYTQKLQEVLSGWDGKTLNPSKVLEVVQTSRPDLHHLREGGSEQEADLVLGLLNYSSDIGEARPTKTACSNLFEIGVLKSRYGVRGAWFGLEWVGKTTTPRNKTQPNTNPRPSMFNPKGGGR